MRRRSPITTWRIVRGRQSDLVRRSDRIDAAFRLALGPLFALLVAAATLAVLNVLHAGHVREETQRHTMHRVESTVVRAHELTTIRPVDPSTTPAWQVQVQWRTATGGNARASVIALHHIQIGDRIPLWVNGRGGMSPVLWSARDSAATAAFAGMSIVAFGCLALAGAAALLRWGMMRQQLADWTVEWEQVARTWTSL